MLALDGLAERAYRFQFEVHEELMAASTSLPLVYRRRHPTPFSELPAEMQEVWRNTVKAMFSEQSDNVLPGWLEIDHSRGVIYFHRPEGTLLRICRLPAPILEGATFIDITLFAGQEPMVSYTGPSLEGGERDG